MTTAYSGDGITFPDASVQATAPRVGMVNRIINGDMRIDQRNAGASVTPVNGQYTLDRWRANLSAASKYSVQQDAGAVTPPVGFNDYLGVTSLSAYTVGAAETFAIQQFIEGYNVADLGWGTANAKTVTLSFWVRSSLTGTFGGSLRNNADNRSYPYTYTISSANTWEYKTVTIAGDTTGTWNTTNANGIKLIFGLGVGSTLSGTAGAWAGSNFSSATGSASVVGTSGATFYVTGVQLEKGSTATDFEYVDYSRQLQMCQRYYENIVLLDVSGYVEANKQAYSNIQLVPKRATPTVGAGSNTNSSNYLSFVVTFGTNDFQHCSLKLNGANGAVPYIRTTFNNFVFNSEL